jgi:L-2-hydroxyglutarate oxidase
VSSRPYDVAIIGGGLLGLATARALLEASPQCALVVLEAEPRVAAHQSGRNSGVIHSGLYYRPGSLKARTCVEGRQALYRFLEEQQIPHERCGKLVIATSARELPILADLERRGHINGLRGLRWVRAEEIPEYEPHARGQAALWVPETGITDYALVAQALARVIGERGGEVRTSARVFGVRRLRREIITETTAGEIACRVLVGCAGLHADRIARLCGLHPELRIIPFRGEYYELIPERRSLVRNLIYPVPDPELPFLGVHFTRRVDGRVDVGPNAVLALKREGYTRWSVSARDVGEMLAFSGFWRLILRHGRAGVREMVLSFSRRAFARALARLVPEVRAQDLRPAASGVRAQAVDPSGRLVDDFRILEAERMVHVLNAPSPAATAALRIGQIVAARVLAQLEGG